MLIRNTTWPHEKGDAIKVEQSGKSFKGYFKRFAKYLEINYDDFWDILDQYVNKKLFKRKSVDDYDKLFTVGEGIK